MISLTSQEKVHAPQYKGQILGDPLIYAAIVQPFQQPHLMRTGRVGCGGGSVGGDGMPGFLSGKAAEEVRVASAATATASAGERICMLR